ncbi:PrpF domain-containing protein [Streptomyces boncukensis]|uniref:Uncharacterized protein n=1 Tax=Streptomyces boncukensis TaxID=2711219 RepID=A0A6G4WRM4_9ACTN|nr:hypothetical protein [Streptomyces boncukensis]
MTRTFTWDTSERCHSAIGVLGAAGVAAGVLVNGSVGGAVACLPTTGERLRIEHPTEFLDVETRMGCAGLGTAPKACRAAVVRTARKILDGSVFPRAHTPAAARSPSVPAVPGRARSPEWVILAFADSHRYPRAGVPHDVSDESRAGLVARPATWSA